MNLLFANERYNPDVQNPKAKVVADATYSFKIILFRAQSSTFSEDASISSPNGYILAAIVRTEFQRDRDGIRR